jgi:hypothetical protein
MEIKELISRVPKVDYEKTPYLGISRRCPQEGVFGPFLCVNNYTRFGSPKSDYGIDENQCKYCAAEPGDTIELTIYPTNEPDGSNPYNGA